MNVVVMNSGVALGSAAEYELVAGPPVLFQVPVSFVNGPMISMIVLFVSEVLLVKPVEFQ